MKALGIMGTLHLEKLAATWTEATGGTYLTHLWYWDRNGRERHEAGELNDSMESELSELTEVLGTEWAAKARELRPGQQAVVKTGYGYNERTRLIHRIN